MYMYTFPVFLELPMLYGILTMLYGKKRYHVTIVTGIGFSIQLCKVVPFLRSCHMNSQVYFTDTDQLECLHYRCLCLCGLEYTRFNGSRC